MGQANGHKNCKGLQVSDIQWEAERSGTIQPGEEMAQGDLIFVYIYLMGGSKEDGTRLSGVPGDSTRGNEHKLKYRNITSSIRKINQQQTNHFYCEVGQTLGHAIQRRCAVFVLGDIQNLTGYGLEQPATSSGPEQPALTAAALSREGWTRCSPGAASNLNHAIPVSSGL